ncbi:hypothetical protein GTY65_00300 [Streptomyces sp. SID8379]|uniref:hypothetical protein n=1 Tax=unclassified Streptomyces TaxID=2593676 RepID=UPI00039F6082|nr:MULTISPECIES: hypothetical protein [unclassified Streptomyces]MYW62528.1 hypothetical protein [Streptomyces sp. SID8379]
MTYRYVRSAALAAAAAALCAAGTAQAHAAAPGGVTFYTGSNQSGTAVTADLSKDGLCRELPAPARSFLAVSDKDVDVFFNSECRSGAPGQEGDLYYRTGTLGQGNFPYAAVSYRVRPAG